jgi:hypothetical protein
LTEGRLSDEHMTHALIIVCTRAEGISVAKLIVRRRNGLVHNTCTTPYLPLALEGHALKIIALVVTVKYKLSRDERVKWWLATASACGDIEQCQTVGLHTLNEIIQML